MFFFIIPFMAYYLTEDISKSGLILAIEWVVRLSVLPWIGLLVAKLGSRRAVLVSDCLRIIIFILVALLWLYTIENRYLILCLLAIGLAFILEVSYVSNETFIVNQFKKDTYRFQNLSQSLDQFAAIVAPGTAALLSKCISFQMFLYVMSVIAIINFMIVLLGSVNESFSRKRKSMASCLQGLLILVKNQELLSLTIWAFLINFLYGAIIATLNYSVIGVYNQTNFVTALIVNIAGVASFIALRIANKHRQSFKEFLSWILLAALGVMLIYTFQNIYIYAICFVIFSVACNFMTLFIRVERASIVPSSKLPLVISAMLFISSISIPLAGLAIYLLGSDGIQKYFIAVGAVLILLCIGQMIFYKKRKITNEIKIAS